MNSRKIFYFCHDHQFPSGGQKEMYRHVDILNSSGYQAYAVHTMMSFKLKWFKNKTRVIDWDKFNRICNKEIDYLVIPEDFGKRMSAFSGNKIIFNQNIYHGFNIFRLKKVRKWPYLDSDVKFVMTVSRHNEKYLRFIFPHLAIRRIYYGIDNSKFAYKSLSRKKKVMVMLMGKSYVDGSFLYQALSARASQNLNKLKEFKWQFLGGYSEEKVTRILGDSFIFIFLSMHEGCPLSCLEAMLSGALVVGYKGGPQAEYINNDNSFLVDPNDKMGLIKKVEEIAAKFDKRDKGLDRISRNAYEAAKNYSLQRERNSVLGFWKEVLGQKTLKQDSLVNENSLLQKIQP